MCGGNFFFEDNNYHMFSNVIENNKEKENKEKKNDKKDLYHKKYIKYKIKYIQLKENVFNFSNQN